MELPLDGANTKRAAQVGAGVVKEVERGTAGALTCGPVVVVPVAV